jgi:predicted HTH domain antitoxin
MTITVEIPEGLLDRVVRAGQDPACAALEAIALEGYRSDRLSEADIRELLGFETRMEVHGFLKEHGVFLHYTEEDLEHDCAVARQAADRVRTERSVDLPGDRPAG